MIKGKQCDQGYGAILSSPQMQAQNDKTEGKAGYLHEMENHKLGIGRDIERRHPYRRKKRETDLGLLRYIFFANRIIRKVEVVQNLRKNYRIVYIEANDPAETFRSSYGDRQQKAKPIVRNCSY